MLNRHRILVAPSRWQEPFGLVALEGIASGCVVVASSGGGLTDAVGGCGLIFPTGNAVALADSIEKLLTEQDLAGSLLSGATEHLKRHKQAVVAQFYLRELSALAQR
jgi:glycosyltransferase involved in cell wall biosynthesis